jgi:hypothetical protein
MNNMWGLLQERRRAVGGERHGRTVGTREDAVEKAAPTGASDGGGDRAGLSSVQLRPGLEELQLILDEAQLTLQREEARAPQWGGGAGEEAIGDKLSEAEGEADGEAEAEGRGRKEGEGGGEEEGAAREARWDEVDDEDDGARFDYHVIEQESGEGASGGGAIRLPNYDRFAYRAQPPGYWTCDRPAEPGFASGFSEASLRDGCSSAAGVQRLMRRHYRHLPPGDTTQSLLQLRARCGGRGTT